MHSLLHIRKKFHNEIIALIITFVCFFIFIKYCYEIFSKLSLIIASTTNAHYVYFC